MEVFGKSYVERLKNAKKDSLNNEILTLVVGDSFAHHQIGTNGNFFDSVFNCEGHPNCNYHNLAQSGVGLPFYWNSILSVLSDRSKDSRTDIIIGIYFGNDIPFIDPSKTSENCNKAHVLNQQMIDQYKDTWIHSFKRTLPSILFLARGLKASTGIGSIKNIQYIKTNAENLRTHRSDPSQKLASINDLASKMKSEIMEQASRNIINPWEISLALANPYYFDDLYSLSKQWSRKSVGCLAENVIYNINEIKKTHPKTNFIIVGIPDKFYWSRNSYKSTTKEYRALGYRFESKEKLMGTESNPLSIFFENTMKSNRIKYIYLPNLINSETNIIDWFYHRDMHINTKGNQNVAELLQKKFNKSERQVSF